MTDGRQDPEEATQEEAAQEAEGLAPRWPEWVSLGVSARGRLAVRRGGRWVERETGIEPATCSLEGCRSAN